MRDAGSQARRVRPSGPRRARAALAAWLLATACGPSPAGQVPDPAPGAPGATDTTTEPHVSRLAPEEAERLAAIGYAEFSEDRGDDERDGVVLHDRERAAPGYNLCSVIPLNVAELLDMEGRLVNRWSLPDGLWLARCELLPGGDVLVVGTRADPASPVRYLARLTWSGATVWLSEARAHHDVEVTPRGEVLTIVTRPRSVSAMDPARDVQDNLLSLFALEDGRPLGELSLAETMMPGSRPLVLQDDVMIHTKVEGADWMHANSVDWMPWPGLAGTSPLYDPANILVSLRHQSVIAIVNWDRRDLVWWWRGDLRRQHEATWLPDGNILLFDNGDENRRVSRIVVVDPRQDRIVWQWTAPVPGDFYSRGQGTAQALPNGNVLVADSGAGEAFEIARDGTVVWRLLGSHRNEKGQRAALRIKRYEPALVEPLIERLGRRGG